MRVQVQHKCQLSFPPTFLQWTKIGPFRQLKIKRTMHGGSGDILCERMVGCLENGPKWCSILVLQLRVRTRSCSIFMDPGQSKRIDSCQ